MWCLPFPLCALCVLFGRALKPYPNSLLAGTLLLFWSVHKQVHLLFLFVRVVLLCVVDFSPTSPDSGAKIVGGFLRSEKSIFPFFYSFTASFPVFSFYFTGARRTTISRVPHVPSLFLLELFL